MRDPELPEWQGDVRHLRDPTGVQDGLALVREERGHLGSRLDVELVGVEPEAPRGIQVVAGAHAQQHIVRFRLLLSDVVEVVGHDERQPDLRAKAQELAVEPLLFREAVVLELQEEVALAEDLAVLAGRLARPFPVLHLQRLGHLAAEAGTEADQPFAVLRQVLVVDAWLVVVPVEMGVRNQATQVLVAAVVLGQEDEVEGLAVRLALLGGHRPGRDVGLHTDDRLDALVPGRLVEGDGAVERAVIRDRHRVHARGGRGVHEFGDSTEAVEQAELGVDVEVRKVVRSEGRQGTSMVDARDGLVLTSGRRMAHPPP